VRFDLKFLPWSPCGVPRYRRCRTFVHPRWAPMVIASFDPFNDLGLAQRFFLTDSLSFPSHDGLRGSQFFVPAIIQLFLPSPLDHVPSQNNDYPSTALHFCAPLFRTVLQNSRLFEGSVSLVSLPPPVFCFPFVEIICRLPDSPNPHPQERFSFPAFSFVVSKFIFWYISLFVPSLQWFSSPPLFFLIGTSDRPPPFNLHLCPFSISPNEARSSAPWHG